MGDKLKPCDFHCEWYNKHIGCEKNEMDYKNCPYQKLYNIAEKMEEHIKIACKACNNETRKNDPWASCGWTDCKTNAILKQFEAIRE